MLFPSPRLPSDASFESDFSKLEADNIFKWGEVTTKKGETHKKPGRNNLVKLLRYNCCVIFHNYRVYHMNEIFSETHLRH